MNDLVTYNDLYLRTRRLLKTAGIEDAQFCARLLICHAAGCTVEELLARLSRYCSPTLPAAVKALTDRCAAGEPIAYITGSWEFYGLPITVTHDVLIPRIDTEVLVDTALKAVQRVNTRTSARVLDLGCGSGCISCAIGRKMPATRLTLVDISPAALEVARQNLALNRLASRAVCIEADMLAPPPLRLGNFDLIVSNPPYIETAELPALDSSVIDWEPRLALDGGEDGLKFYRSIAKHWLSVLSDSGSVIMEVGEGQADPVMELLEKAGLRGIGSVRDTAGTERVVYGSR